MLNCLNYLNYFKKKYVVWLGPDIFQIHLKIIPTLPVTAILKVARYRRRGDRLH